MWLETVCVPDKGTGIATSSSSQKQLNCVLLLLLQARLCPWVPPPSCTQLGRTSLATPGEQQQQMSKQWRRKASANAVAVVSAPREASFT
jgi:hypothetical protein